MSDKINEIIDSGILKQTIKAKRERPKITADEVRKIVQEAPSNDDIVKRDFLIDLYGKIVEEYQKVLDVLRKRAAADKRTIMKLNTPELKEAAEKLFGPNVQGITLERYLDLLRLEKDLNMICVQDNFEEGGVLNAE